MLREILRGDILLAPIAAAQIAALRSTFSLRAVGQKVQAILKDAAKKKGSDVRDLGWIEQFSIFAERVSLKHGMM
jgi:hypothetical protein